MIEISGYLLKQIFYNETNGYVIGLFKVKKIAKEHKTYKNKTIIITGIVPGINPDQQYVFKGDFIDHPRYGEQFSITSYDVIAPEDKEGIIAFLSSDLFPGVGIKAATKVVETLGEDCLNILNEHDTAILDVAIKPSQQSTIIDVLRNYNHSHAYIIKLTNLGFKLEDAILIYNAYKENIDQILNNLYEICFKLEKITFKTVHKIIKSKNLPYLEHTYRKLVVYETIKNLSINQGHTCLTIDELYSKFNSDINDLIDALAIDKLIIIRDERIWLYELYYDEVYIANFFDNKRTLVEQVKFDGLTKHQLNAEQITAIEAAFKNRFSIITGGPGTGKTTIIKHIVKLYKQYINHISFHELVLLAPTGKASKRMTEATKYPASTIHRFLKWDKENDTFEVNINNKSDAKMVIIDEMSMVDTTLMASLLRGLKDDCVVVMVGDDHQLPSIRAGQVLKDLINSRIINVTHLNHVYRQKAGTNINFLGHAIINDAATGVRDADDGHSIFYKNLNHQEIVTYILKTIDEVKYIDDLVVLVPMYRGSTGIDRINDLISEHINGKEEQFKYGSTVFRVKDKVLLTVNMPDQNVYNGDIGYIVEFDHDKKRVYISFDDVILEFKFGELNNFKLGFALSIHKSQGSEYKQVLLVCTKESYRMLTRPLLYTGLTRAKEVLHVLGDTQLFITSVLKHNEQNRITYLPTLMHK